MTGTRRAPPIRSPGRPGGHGPGRRHGDRGRPGRGLAGRGGRIDRHDLHPGHSGRRHHHQRDERGPGTRLRAIRPPPATPPSRPAPCCPPTPRGAPRPDRGPRPSRTWRSTRARPARPTATSPYPSGTVGTPGPSTATAGPATSRPSRPARPARQPAGTTLPFAPAYFPHIVRNADGSLTGYFDYRPKDADEALVAAKSTDDGKDWTYEGEALEQNPGYCPTPTSTTTARATPTSSPSAASAVSTPCSGRPATSRAWACSCTPSHPDRVDQSAGRPAGHRGGRHRPRRLRHRNVARRRCPPVAGSPSPSTTTGTAGSPEQLRDRRVRRPDPRSDAHCQRRHQLHRHRLASNTLTGCTTTAPDGLTVEPERPDRAGHRLRLGQDRPVPGTVPAGPNTTTGDGGLAKLYRSRAPASTPARPTSASPTRSPARPQHQRARTAPTSTAYGDLLQPGQRQPDHQDRGLHHRSGQAAPLALAAGDPITSDPIVPAPPRRGQTTGLVAPDGIVGVLPSYPGRPVPAAHRTSCTPRRTSTTTSPESPRLRNITFTRSRLQLRRLPSAPRRTRPARHALPSSRSSDPVTV